MPRRSASVDVIAGVRTFEGIIKERDASFERERSCASVLIVVSTSISDPSLLGMKADTAPFSLMEKVALIGSVRVFARSSSKKLRAAASSNA